MLGPIINTAAMRAHSFCGAILFLCCATGISQAASALPADQALAREILAQLVQFRSTAEFPENIQAAARAMADRLLEAGFPPADVQVVGPGKGPKSLVARFRGTGREKGAILLMAHIDVVDALLSDWSTDPFVMIEQDGYLYGRGTNDNKAGAAMLIANLIRLKRGGVVPSRDLIVVLTGDEESGQDGIKWLLSERRELVQADIALNTDGGSGELVQGRPAVFTVQTGEKVYLSFRLEVRNPGGHSSIPRKDNAIYQLAAGLTRLAALTFPPRLNETTMAYFGRSALAESGPKAQAMKEIASGRLEPGAVALVSESPYHNSMLRTTCVATRLEGGHADNALPQTAAALVNCRLFPGDSPKEVEETLQSALADPAISVTPTGKAVPSPASPLLPEVIGPIRELAGQLFPGAEVVPEMSTGGTDGLYVRNAGIPTYGVAAVFDDPNDLRAHGRDERIGVKAFYDALEFWYLLTKKLATERPRDSLGP